jgi:hypothetical protein
MVADELTVLPKSIMMMVVTMPVNYDAEVCKDKESREPEVPPPERIRDPGVQIGIIRRRCIVRDYRRTLVIVIVVYDRSVRAETWSITLNLSRTGRINGQSICDHDVLKGLQCLVLGDGQPTGICRIDYRTPQFAGNIRRDGVISNPAVARRYTDTCQHALCFSFV